MLNKNIDQHGQPLLKNRADKDLKVQVRIDGWMEFYLKKLLEQYGENKSEYVRRLIENDLSKHFNPIRLRKGRDVLQRVIHKISNVLRISGKY